jgi:FlaA1/EpsC-like NDP-sugar epimerase
LLIRNKSKIIIFGAGISGKIIYEKLKDKYDIVAFFDNDKTKQNTIFDGVNVMEPKPLDIFQFNIEFIVIASNAWNHILQSTN